MSQVPEDKGAVEPVDLARTPGFQLGALRVRPVSREIEGPAGRAMIEPRMMEVLVVLARAAGEVVTRDQLIAACWGGRIVSDDAINRVISRLRGLAEGAGQGSFAIETVPKVGYRLLAGASSAAAPASPAPAAARPSRRLLIGGAVAAAAAGAGVAAWRFASPRPPAPAGDPRARELHRQAVAVMWQYDPTTDARAVAFLREAVALSPDWADAWAALALAYAGSLDTNPASEHAALRAGAEDAARRTLSIDPGNADARGALAMLDPFYGRWSEAEQAFREVLALKPKLAPLHTSLASLLVNTGQAAAAVPEAEQGKADQPLSPVANFIHGGVFWSAGRLEEAERSMGRTAELWPRTAVAFFPRVYLLLHSGRARRALDMVEDLQERPRGIPASDFDLVASVARAVLSGAAADRKAALDANLAAARRGHGYAYNAVSFACTLGDVDAAFELASAYHFGRPFEIGAVDFTAEQGLYSLSRVRQTMNLFWPPTAKMRADARFPKLVEEIGLAAYWRAAGRKPDFCAAGCAWLEKP